MDERGLPSSLVPKLVGEPERTAQARLQQDGLELSGSRRHRSDRAGDTVVAQDPAAGHAPRVRSLLVNRGERAAGYVMPDLIGVAGEAAVEP